MSVEADTGRILEWFCGDELPHSSLRRGESRRRGRLVDRRQRTAVDVVGKRRLDGRLFDAEMLIEKRMLGTVARKRTQVWGRRAAGMRLNKSRVFEGCSWRLVAAGFYAF